jgi:hypothetical protein
MTPLRDLYWLRSDRGECVYASRRGHAPPSGSGAIRTHTVPARSRPARGVNTRDHAHVALVTAPDMEWLLTSCGDGPELASGFNQRAGEA